MNSEDDILDPSMLNFEEDFDTQVSNLMCHVRLTAGEVQNLRHLFADVEEALQGLAPGLLVKPFGSIVTGLGIRTSDVDCYIQLPQDMRPSTKYVIRARNMLRKKFRIFTNLFAITTAKVPIVKFLHIPTNCNCDVNFKSPAGVLNSQLVAHLLHMDSNDRVLKLAILVKYWSKMHKITGTNLLASYALTLMVVFYLQLMNILPSIAQMQVNVPPYMVDNWNMAFDSSIHANTSNNDSLYDLLGGFFKCYSNLNFEENIISPYLGRLLHKKAFKNFDDVPEQFEQYKLNMFGKLCKSLKTESPICIQDPFEHARNCSVSVYPKLAMKIKGHFQFAAKKFDELRPEYFLRAILTEDPTRMMPNVKQKQKHVFHNKVMKQKHVPPQRKFNPHPRECHGGETQRPRHIHNIELIHDLPQHAHNPPQVTPIPSQNERYSPQHTHHPPQHDYTSNQHTPIPPQNERYSSQDTYHPPQHTRNRPHNERYSPPRTHNPRQIERYSPQRIHNPLHNEHYSPQPTHNPRQNEYYPSQSTRIPPENERYSPQNTKNSSQYTPIPSVLSTVPSQHGHNRPNNRGSPTRPKKRGLQKYTNLIRCFHQIQGIKKSKTKLPNSRH